MKVRSKIAVAGATGRVGRHVVDVLRARGHEVVPISRSNDIDLVTGNGLAAALEDAECVIDAATGPSPEQTAATAFFTTAARNLHEFGVRAGVHRVVAVSIIGTDRFTGGYGAAKIAHERTHLEGAIPVRILRAAQFHEFVPQLVARGRQDDVSYVPNMRSQPVAARTVAEMLADLSDGSDEMWASSAQSIFEIAGPREESVVDLARLLVATRDERLRIEGVTDPADPDRELYLNGALLAGPTARRGGPTFEEWLATSQRSDLLALRH